MNHYSHHAFFCCNQRPEGEACCNNHGASDLLAYAKDQARALGVDRERIRINKAGCLGRCDEGPLIVVYPEGVWYTYVDRSDIDEIVSEHLLHGRIVDRLRV
ncbi:MAG TPA: (2Fe-2S) ferredoxin domain-containing protein [Rhodocyclaceae bacterium]|nr:(2Fe-2S) ferredoxin domain-containing protein [Rhodocyclaceae bacterium]